MSNANSYTSRAVSFRFRRSANKPYIQPPPSPIEISFWEEAKPLIPELKSEVPIGAYRVDFLIPSKKVVVELYGYKWHNTKEKITQDMQRERYLQRHGYQVLAFTGTEVYHNPRACAQEVAEYLASLPALTSTRPAERSTSLPDDAPPPFRESVESAQHQTRAVTSTLQLARKKKRLLGLQPRQLGVVIGFFVFDLLIIGIGLLLALS